MRVDILLHRMEPTERWICGELSRRGYLVTSHDVHFCDEEAVASVDPTGVVLNRVYASVANDCYPDIAKTVRMLRSLEARGVTCVNSRQASHYDYSKYDSARCLRALGIPTPRTVYISHERGLERVKGFVGDVGFPLILKRNTGGRAKDIFKIYTMRELVSIARSLLAEDYCRAFGGGLVVQEYLRQTRAFDCRIGVVDERFAFCYGRTLISPPGERDPDPDPAPWLGSVSLGSRIIDYRPSPEEIDLAIRATRAVGADLSEVDMAFTADGPVIIESNATPNYLPDSSTDVARLSKALDMALRRHERPTASARRAARYGRRVPAQ